MSLPPPALTRSRPRVGAITSLPSPVAIVSLPRPVITTSLPTPVWIVFASPFEAGWSTYSSFGAAGAVTGGAGVVSTGAAGAVTGGAGVVSAGVVVTGVVSTGVIVSAGSNVTSVASVRQVWPSRLYSTPEIVWVPVSADVSQ